MTAYCQLGKPVALLAGLPADSVTCDDLGGLSVSDRDYPWVLLPSGTQRARLDPLVKPLVSLLWTRTPTLLANRRRAVGRSASVQVTILGRVHPVRSRFATVALLHAVRITGRPRVVPRCHGWVCRHPEQA
jgi:hypothetical protein